MTHPPARGRSVATRRAVEAIVEAAVRSSYGITGFAGRGPLARLVGRATGREPGIDLRSLDPLRIGVRVQVAPGLPVAEVARQLESATRYAIRRSLGREIAELIVDVAGLGRGTTESPDDRGERDAGAGGTPVGGEPIAETDGESG